MTNLTVPKWLRGSRVFVEGERRSTFVASCLCLSRGLVADAALCPRHRRPIHAGR